MAIRYEPKKILRRLAKKSNVKALVTDKLTVNKAALNAIETSGVLGKKQLEWVALGVIKGMREKAEDLQNEGLSAQDAREEVAEDKRLLVQRVQNAMVSEVTKQVKKQYRGEFYTWLPSTAANPDPKHRKKYGKRYQLGKGEAPGDRMGCQCGMEIHVKASRLVLE